MMLLNRAKMGRAGISVPRDIRKEVSEARFSAVRANEFNFQPDLVAAWEELRGTWTGLALDRYYGGCEGNFRERRYSDFSFDPRTGDLEPLAHHAYYQSEEQNRYVGGLERHFQDIPPETFENPFFKELVKFSFQQFPIPEKFWEDVWTAQVHQIRIVVGPGETAEITPEGIHTDGYPFASVHLVERQGIEGAVSSVYTWEETSLASLTFENPFDSLFIEDRAIKHYVSPMKATGDTPGERSILAISFSLPGSPYVTVE